MHTILVRFTPTNPHPLPVYCLTILSATHIHTKRKNIHLFCHACNTSEYFKLTVLYSRSQLPRGRRRGSAAAHLLRSWARIPPGAWMFVCCECCVLSGKGLCDELITRPEESYRMWCFVTCDQETS